MALISFKGVARRSPRQATAGAPLVGALSLESEDKEPIRSIGDGRFALVVDGSSDALDVDASSLKAELLKLEERSKAGAWATIEADPLAAAFLDRAPGPHLEVKIKGAALLPGDVVHVLGEVTETELIESTAGMRTAPAERPAAIRAVALAAGPFAKAFIEQARQSREPAAARPAEAPRSSFWAPFLWSSIVITGLALLLSLALTSARVRGELGMLVITVIALIARFRMDPPMFRGREAQPPLSRWDLYYLFAGLSVLGAAIAFCVHALRGSSAKTPDESVIIPLLALVVAVLPFEAAAQTRQCKRIGRLLLDARVGGSEDGAWTAVEGVVRDPTPVDFAGAKAAIGRKVGAFEKPDILTDTTFEIDAGAERVIVDPADACWATLVTQATTIEVDEKGGESKKGSKKATTTKTISEEWIPVGASVIAVGRIQRSEGVAKMTPTGPESLLLFAAPPGSSARAELTSALRVRLASILVLTAVAVLGCATAFALLMLG